MQQILLYYSAVQDYPLAGIPNPSAIKPNFLTLEATMKVPLTLLFLAFTAAAFSAMPAGARQAAADQPSAKAAAKETKWQGHVVRIDKEHSMIDLRGGPAPSKSIRKIAYDGSTEWTKLAKPSQQDAVTDGAFIIVLGHVDDKGILHATRVDLRNPR